MSTATLRPLAATELHLWRLRLDLPARAQSATETALAPDERERAAHFYFAADARRFVAAHGQLRQLISAYVGRRPAELVFAANDFGKPGLAAPADVLQFNLAHSGAWALVALTAAVPVGVDVEACRPITDRAAIAERFFAPGEAQRLSALPAGEQAAAFFRCWTRKEAYLKARGLGLSLPLDAFEVTLETGQPRLLWVQDDPAEAAAWQLLEPAMPPGYAAAIAVRGREAALVDCGEWPIRGDT
ncbi:MAG: 4'-phosphopantetheinyl transferase superfamily protein [Anaerolineales bacterium]|nr:4'-phosphopantetheinyl transferase superfamily protein [Anaerolineales bacterium]